MIYQKAIRPTWGGWLFSCTVSWRESLVLLAMLTLLWTSSCQTPLLRTDDLPSNGNRGDLTVVGEAARPVDLERSWGSGLLALDAAVLGKNGNSQRVNFVVDSGAEISGFLEALAIGLPEGQERVEVHTLHGGSLDGMTVMAGVFPWPVELAPGVVDSMPESSFVVFPASANLPGRANGLLGADFLLSERIAVDIGGARLLPSPASVPAPRNSWVRLDLVTAAGVDNPLRFLKINTGVGSINWLVDSGAERSLLTREAAARLGIKVSRSGQNTQLVDAGGGRVSLGRAKLKDLTWGANRLPGFVVGVAPMANLRRLRTSSGGAVDGVLGLDFLQRHSAIIDLPAGALWVRLP